MHEIELKLALADEAAAQHFIHSRFIQTLKARQQTLHSTYFDSHRADLQRLHAALRIRQDGLQRLQTLKYCSTLTDSTLQKCLEWEIPITELEPNLDLLPDPTWCDTIKRALNDRPLIALFDTHFVRHLWDYRDLRGNAIEIALDQGYIACQNQRLAICEIELELKQGEDEACLYELAQFLRQDLRLAPSHPGSKAKRGYRLAAENGLIDLS